MHALSGGCRGSWSPQWQSAAGWAHAVKVASGTAVAPFNKISFS